MGTRSDIIAKCTDGKWRRIYCHWDGYLDHNGRILFAHYRTQSKIDALIALGDLSSLERYCTKPAGHSFDNRKKGYTVAYGRDRGETGTEATVGDTLSAVWPDDETGTEFTYVWDGAKWWVGDPDTGSQNVCDLKDALDGKVVLTPKIKAFGVNLVVGQHKPQPRAN